MENPKQEIDSNESNPLFDIIQNIQSKLDDTSTKESPNDATINNITELLNNVGLKNNVNENNNINTDTKPNSSNLNLDLSSIMKISKIFNSMKEPNPRKNLLLSLKPFLRETRQKNIDTYITLLSVINTLDIFSNKGK